MANFNFQGKLIRQSTYTSTRLQFVTWGGGGLAYQNGSLSNKITFFHYEIEAG